LRFKHNINYFNIKVTTPEHQFKRCSSYWPRK